MLEQDQKVNESRKQDWRQVMVTQYSIFGTIAGLEVTALAIYVSFRTSISFPEKIIFSISSFFLLLEVMLILWLINQERKVAFDESVMFDFMRSEFIYRNILIIIMIITWGLILSLLILRIWL